MKIRLLLAILAYLPGVLLTTAFHELKAQQKRYALPQIIPKSPDVASMEVYGTIPVSESTGTSNLSIPLVNLTIGSFTLPISLNYYKSGLKVEEVPSSVGDGWSLQYGGMISFQQRGINDFKQYGMLYGGPGSGALTQVKKLLRGHMTSYERWNYLESLIRGDLDSEFDQYNYNFLGKSGSYYYDSLMQVVLLPKSDLKVIRQENEIRIIDNDNNIYYFGAIENASSYDASDVEVRPSFNDISAYYLSKIVTKENRVILFKYKNYSFSVNQVKTGITHMQASSNPDCNISGVNAYNEIINIGCLLPDSIIFDQGFVKFVQGTSVRQDLKQVAPNAVVPYIKGFYVANTNGEKTKEYSFDQGYFGTNRRLKLSTVNEMNGAQINKSWNFKYWNETADFPILYSKSKDHWGYYNAAVNGSLLPVADYSNFIYGWVNYSISYADRSSNFNSVLGMLEEIRYPTGGSTKFEYEPNQIKVASYSSIRDMSPFLLLNNATSFESLVGVNTALLNGPLSGSFVIPPNAEGGAPTVKIRGFVEYDPSHFEDPIYTFTGPGGNDNLSKLNNAMGMNYSSTSNTSGGEVTATLLPGNYTYSLIPGRTFNNQTSQYIPKHLNFSISIERIADPLPYIIGGVRIAKITTNDSIGRTSVFKRYVYNDSLNTVSFKNIPNYYYRSGFSVPAAWSTSCYPCGDRISIYDESIVPFAGNHIEYSKVTVYDSSVTTGQLGKTENDYLLSLNDAGSYAPPYVAPVNTSWRTGVLAGRKIYKRENNSFILIQETQNSYAAKNKLNLVNGIKVNYALECSARSEGTVQYNVSLSTLFSEQFNLSQTKTWDYSSANSLMNQTDYTISSTAHTLPSITSMLDSKSEPVKEKILYSFDYDTTYITSSEAKAIRNLRRLNVLVPIEKISYKTIAGTDYVIGASLTLYKEDRSFPDKIYQLNLNTPVLMSAFISSTINGAGNVIKDSRYEQVVVFNSYDEYNNLSLVTPSSAGPISYLYDYKKEYPIAEIKNASSSDVAYTSFEGEQKGNWTYAAATVNDGTAPTGKKCYNAGSGAISKTGLETGKVYTLSYWTKNAAASTIAGTMEGYPINVRSANGWTLFVHRITGVSAVTFSSGYIDELRLYPADAMMSTYTYKPLVGVATVCDEKNNIVYYDYDNMGRLKVIKDIDGKVVKQFDYQFQVSITK